MFMKSLGSDKALKDDDIANIVINYIDENLYNYAVMIDGAWGCGKTYFVKEYLIEKIEQNEKQKKDQNKNYNCKRVVYISLYGVKSVDDVSKQVFMESYLAKADKAKGILRKGTEFVGTLLPVAFDVVKSFTGIETDVDKLFGIVNDFLTIKNCIFIFDDLERCDCNINEILGYINGFVEHYGFKVILVANQNEVGKGAYINNLELKYLVALNQNIDFELKTESRNKSDTQVSENAQKETQKIEPVSISMLENRINRLFGQDIMYERVKEKLVGITIYYQPDLQIVFLKLIKNDNLNSKMQSYLNENIGFFEAYMLEEEHLNLRTFQFFLSKINDLYKEITKIQGRCQEEFLKHIILYCFKICIVYKNGSFKYKWEKNEEYSFKSIGKNYIFGNMLAFRFVDDFVIKSSFDAKRAESMVRIFEDEYFKERNAFRELDATWYLLEDSEVERKIGQIFEDLENNVYGFKIYSRIIGRFIELEQVGFSKENIDFLINKMKGNIFKLGHHIKLDTTYGLMVEGDIKKKYKEIVEQLQKDIDQHFQKNILKTLEDYLDMEDEWGGKLEKYVYSNKTEICQTSGFLTQININKLCEKIKKSKSKDINSFRSCIISLYVSGIMGDGIKKDEERLEELINGIKEMDSESFDKIKKMQINYLSGNLQRAVEIFNS